MDMRDFGVGIAKLFGQEHGRSTHSSPGNEYTEILSRILFSGEAKKINAIQAINLGGN